MRLNKKKLAALAMSAVMAASTMPFPVLAEEFTDGGEVAVADTYAVTVSDVEIDLKGNVTITYDDGTKSYATTTEKVLRKKAVCGVSAAQYAYTYTVGGKTGFSDDFAEGEVPQHHYVTKEEWIKYPTCTENGSKKVSSVCENCEAVNPDVATQTVVVAKLDHTWGENKVRYGLLTNITYTDKDDPNTYKLTDDTKDGTYTKVTYHVCEECGKSDDIEREKITIKATNVSVKEKVVVLGADSNIKDTRLVAANTTDNKVQLATVKDNEIALKDCKKDGKYWIVSLDKNGVEIDREEHIVEAHHVESVTFAPKTADDALMLVATYDEDHNQTGYTNKSCNKDAYYYVTTTCTAEGKQLSKEEVKAEPAGAHKVKSASKFAVNKAKKEADTNGCLSVASYEELKATAATANSGIKLTVKDSCETVGTLTVTYYCQECGEPTGDVVTMNVAKLGHDWSETTRENVVEATCSKEGSYDTVRTCKVCGEKEVVRTGVIIPKTAHSFIDKNGATVQDDAYITFTGNVVVDVNGESLDDKGKAFNSNQYYSAFTVTADAVVKCDVCGETEKLADLDLTVADIQKESGNGEAGSITLKTTYVKALSSGKTEKIEDTYTVPYFSNMVAYLDRNPAKDPINGLHKDDDGVWRYYENNEVTDFTGIADYQGGKFFVANGVLCSDAKGLNLYNGEWYFLAGGQIQTQVTGLAMYNGEWFFLTNGKLDRSKTGLVEYDGAKFIIAKGELQRYSGLWQDPADGTWYFAALGQIQEQYTGTAIYDGQTFELVNGKLVR